MKAGWLDANDDKLAVNTALDKVLGGDDDDFFGGIEKSISEEDEAKVSLDFLTRKNR